MNEHEVLEYDVTIYFLDGRLLTWRLKNSDSVLLQMKYRNFKKGLNTKIESNLFDRCGLLLDVSDIMAITEKEVDYGD
jgi:hypothetical protein